MTTLSYNLYLKLKLNHCFFKNSIRFVHTSSTTTTTVSETPKQDPNISSNKTENTTTSSPVLQDSTNKTQETSSNSMTIDERIARLKDDNAQLEDILKTPSLSADKRHVAENTDTTIIVPHSHPNHTYDQSYNVSSDFPLETQPVPQVAYPSNTFTPSNPTTDIHEAMMRIGASCKLTGQAIVDKLAANDVLLEESEKAEQRQLALHQRIKEFVESFNVSKQAVRIGLGLGIGYTLYYLIRYKQIPLGGFIKGLLFSNNMGGNASLPPTVNNPVNNIIITMPSMPSAETAKAAAQSAQTAGSSFINAMTNIELSPTAMMVLACGSWVLVHYLKLKARRF